ncbi:MAG: HU family DNA-binding protein [Phycisphaerae bacterium]
MDTVTKKQLTDRVADATGNKRVLIKNLVQRFLDEVVSELAKGNRLEFRDFGVFTVRERKPRIAQNPRTLERVEVPSKRTVKFKVGRRMRDRIQKPAGKPAFPAVDRRIQPTRSDAPRPR